MSAFAAARVYQAVEESQLSQQRDQLVGSFDRVSPSPSLPPSCEFPFNLMSSENKSLHIRYKRLGVTLTLELLRTEKGKTRHTLLLLLILIHSPVDGNMNLILRRRVQTTIRC